MYKEMTKEQKQDIGEMSGILIILPNEDREVLMSNARAFMARQVIVNSKNPNKKPQQTA